MKNKILNEIKEIILSLLLMLLYYSLWISLEWVENGKIITRRIDNEIMLALTPIFLLSAKYLLRKDK